MSMLIYRFLKINQREVEFSRRGFTCSKADVRARLENVGRFFLRGYHAALQEADQSILAENLNHIDHRHRGFAYEGAAMAMALMDGISFRSNSFARFLAGDGSEHVFMLHVGAGWAYARLPWMRWCIETVIKKLHPVLRWLVMDGYGFHEGYFYGGQQQRIRDSVSKLSLDARHVFHQGLGRSLWFAKGADVQEISASISRFPLLYHNDAWSGIGLACAYAGGIPPNEIVELQQLAGTHAPALAQGAAFAAKARQLAGNPASHTELACSLLCQMGSEDATALCDQTFIQIDLLNPCPYQHWRELMQKSLPSSSFSEILVRGKPHEPNESPLLVAKKSH
jgi:enediyne biosynthesis protein E3